MQGRLPWVATAAIVGRSYTAVSLDRVNDGPERSPEPRIEYRLGVEVSGRARHPRKELETLLRAAEVREWEVTYNSRGNYWRVRCTKCRKHQRSIHKSPSDPNYPKNVEMWFRRSQGCWDLPKEAP